MSEAVRDREAASSEELAQAGRAGDVRSFECLVKRHTKRLIALAYRYTRDWDAAQDLCQETWIRVHGEFSRYDANRPFEPWLFTIHRNLCLSHLRRVSRRRARSEAATPLRLVKEDDPLAGTLRREFTARLGAALHRLSRRQRRVFALVDLEETSQTEAARMLGITHSTLRATLHVARRRLADLLTKMEKES